MEEEMKFLKSILDKYFVSVIQEMNINRIQLLSNELSQLSMVKSNVVKDILIHQGHLEAKISGLLEKSVDFFNLESSRIEDEIQDIYKCFRNIKKEIFTIYKNRSSKYPAKINTLISLK
jgi:hypothetical protein